MAVDNSHSSIQAEDNLHNATKGEGVAPQATWLCPMASKKL